MDSYFKQVYWLPLENKISVYIFILVRWNPTRTDSPSSGCLEFHSKLPVSACNVLAEISLPYVHICWWSPGDFRYLWGLEACWGRGPPREFQEPQLCRGTAVFLDGSVLLKTKRGLTRSQPEMFLPLVAAYKASWTLNQRGNQEGAVGNLDFPLSHEPTGICGQLQGTKPIMGTGPRWGCEWGVVGPDTVINLMLLSALGFWKAFIFQKAVWSTYLVSTELDLAQLAVFFFFN